MRIKINEISWVCKSEDYETLPEFVSLNLEQIENDIKKDIYSDLTLHHIYEIVSDKIVELQNTEGFEIEDYGIQINY